MKMKLIHLILLFAMTFNIAHASIIASEDNCAHESISEYVGEMDHSQDCDDLCDFHYLFHMTAIITPVLIFVTSDHATEQPDAALLTYHPPFKRTEQKPPIA